MQQYTLNGIFSCNASYKKSINRIQYNSFRTQITSWVINHSLTTIIRNHFLQQVRFREDSWGLRDIVTYLGNAQSILGSSTWTNKNRENRVSKLHIILHNYKNPTALHVFIIQVTFSSEIERNNHRCIEPVMGNKGFCVH